LGFVNLFTKTKVPMEFGHSVLYFISWALIVEEIRSLTHIKMTNEERWDPFRVGGRHRSREEMEHRKIIASVQIDQQTICAERPEEPQLTYCKAEYDILLASCLVASVHIALCYKEDDGDSLMDKVELWKTAAVYTRAQHTAMLAEEVSRKFGAGLKTARNTLKATTQYGI
jgi:hypothetical protein